MTTLLRIVSCCMGLIAAFDVPFASAQRPTSAAAPVKAQTYAPELVERGHQRFQQNCAFCHGRDASGGESGPDLTHSSAVAADQSGDKIGLIVRNGLPGGMPKFKFADPEIAELVAFIHTQAANSNSDEAKRRKIGLADLLTGSAEAGKQFFNGQGKCASCHSPSGDLAGIAKRYDPMKLETRMLYPGNGSSKVVVTLPSGATIQGRLIHEDEFTIAVRSEDGWQHTWPVSEVMYKISAPAEEHVRLLPLYSDADVHNLFAYLNTLTGAPGK